MESKHIAEMIIKKELELKEVEKQLSAVQVLLDEHRQLQEYINGLKRQLKDAAKPEGEKITQTFGEHTLSVNVYNTHRVTIDDIDKIPEDYLVETEVSGIIERDGKYYQKQGNIDLVKNNLKLSIDPPEGFLIKNIRNISIKFDGKTI